MTALLAFLSQRRKAIAAFVTAEITWATVSLPDSHVSFVEWIAQATLVAGILGVHAVTNDQPGAN